MKIRLLEVTNTGDHQNYPLAILRKLRFQGWSLEPGVSQSKLQSFELFPKALVCSAFFLFVFFWDHTR